MCSCLLHFSISVSDSKYLGKSSPEVSAADAVDEEVEGGVDDGAEAAHQVEDARVRATVIVQANLLVINQFISKLSKLKVFAWYVKKRQF